MLDVKVMQKCSSVLLRMNVAIFPANVLRNQKGNHSGNISRVLRNYYPFKATDRHKQA